MFVRTVAWPPGEDGESPLFASEWRFRVTFGRSAMSEERKSVLRRFEERLAHLEALRHEKPAQWKIFHLHNALNSLPDDHGTADMHLDEFDRHDLAKEYPELEADKVPTVEEIRSRFDMMAGGML